MAVHRLLEISRLSVLLIAFLTNLNVQTAMNGSVLVFFIGASCISVSDLEFFISSNDLILKKQPGADPEN